MTDLRTAAQAVDDSTKANDLVAFSVAMKALRQALAEPVEPVAWMHPDGRVVSGETMNGARKDGGAILSSLKNHNIPLYTTPPSVDALIAEAIEKHDDELAIAKTVNTRKLAQPYLDALIAEIDGLLVLEELGFQTAIKISDIKAILDKYRGVK